MAKSAEEQLKEMLKGSETRASQYASYYTQMGWQRWDTAAAVVAQQIADRKLKFQEASDIYQKELAALEKRRADLQKRLADISIKKAAAQIKREDAEWKERNARYREEYKAKGKQARDDAYVASTSYSHGWSKSYGTGTGSSVRGAGGRDALDEALDEVGADGGLTAKTAVGSVAGAANDFQTGATELKNLKARMKSGQLDNTQYGAGVTMYGAHRYIVSKLAQTYGISEDDARATLDNLINDSEIAADVKYGAQAVLDRAQKGAGSGSITSESQRKAGAKGGYYGDYALPPMEPVKAEAVNLKPLEDAEKEIKEQIAATAGKVPVKPVLEPIDVITATRNEYMTKFGDAPRGTTLRMNGETIGKYKNLMPYELTNALGKVKTFFGNYIQTEVAVARDAARQAGRDLTTDEFNAAVELGKKKARDILFSGLAARDPQYAAATTTPTAVAGSTSAAATTSFPSDERGWASVGIVYPEDPALSKAEKDAAYQTAKEAWAAGQGIKPQNLQEVKDRIDRYNREVLPDAAMEKQQRDMREARDAGILPYDIPEGAPLPDTTKLQAPPVTESEYEAFFRNRVAPPAPVAESANVDIGGMLEAQRQRIESDDLRRRSMEGERRAPAMEVKPEGAIGPIPAPVPTAPRSAADILLRGFKPELDRRTGGVIIPQMTPQERQDAIVGMTSGSQQASLFPESMSPSMPRTTTEGVAARPLAVGELKPTLNKLDRAALGIPDTVGTPVGSEVLGGDMGAAQRRKEEFRKALEDAAEKAKERKEFLQKAGEIGKPESGATLEQRDTKAKTEAVLAGTKLATENPAAAGKSVTKDAMGKYIAAVYDENKIKGAKAKPLGELTQTIIREYAGTPEKQKKAVEILSSLAALDSTSGKINA